MPSGVKGKRNSRLYVRFWSTQDFKATKLTERIKAWIHLWHLRWPPSQSCCCEKFWVNEKYLATLAGILLWRLPPHHVVAKSFGSTRKMLPLSGWYSPLWHLLWFLAPSHKSSHIWHSTCTVNIHKEAPWRSIISWPSFIHLVHRLDVSFSSKDPQKVVKWCKAKSHEYLWRDWLLGDHLVEATFRTCVPGIRNLMSHWRVYNIHNIHNIESFYLCAWNTKSDVTLGEHT